MKERKVCIFFKSWYLFIFHIFLIQDWKLEKKSSDIFTPNSTSDTNGGNFNGSELNDEEAPLLSSRLSHIGRSQLSKKENAQQWVILKFEQKRKMRNEEMKYHSTWDLPSNLKGEYFFFGIDLSQLIAGSNFIVITLILYHACNAILSLRDCVNGI